MDSITSLMPAARNCINGYGRVKPNEQVVLWLDRSMKVEGEIIEALSLALEESKAKTAIIVSPMPIHRLGGEIASPVLAAIEKADLVITFTDFNNAATVDNYRFGPLLSSGGIRSIAMLALTRDMLLSEWAQFPADLLWAIYRNVIKSAKSGKDDVFHLIGKNGTDLKGRLPFQSGFNKLSPPSTWEFFPSGDMAERPLAPLEGKIVFDYLEGFGALEEPISLVVENQWVKRVEGAYEAKWLEKMMKRYTNGNYVCEVTIGVHPKVPRQQAISIKACDTLLFRRAGTFHCGLGVWPHMPLEPFSEWHWDGGGEDISFIVGDQVLIEEGKVLAFGAPEVREIAKKYGDPDDLLSLAT